MEKKNSKNPVSLTERLATQASLTEWLGLRFARVAIINIPMKSCPGGKVEVFSEGGLEFESNYM